ncbi:MAG: hypothetical protein HC927_08890 [Deltaproteobacteria bacterium]|nr:hypothetical protein [Deltaproteobacteria bacterium]
MTGRFGALHVFWGVLFACTPQSSESEDGEASTTSLEAEDESGVDTSWPPPEHCETRQQEPNGVLTAPADVQPVCDADPPGWLIALHRPESVTCTTEPAATVPCTDPGGECQFDGDCEDLVAGGKCASFDGLGGLCSCVLPCSTDDDCPADRACLCRSALFFEGDYFPIVSHTGCWPASCREDADCGPDGECAMATESCGPPALACRGPGDACQSDLDCSEGADCTPGGGSWSCVDNSSCQ